MSAGTERHLVLAQRSVSGQRTSGHCASPHRVAPPVSADRRLHRESFCPGTNAPFGVLLQLAESARSTAVSDIMRDVWVLV
jgi:hypothetical protein